jgi:hypothetical protein
MEDRIEHLEKIIKILCSRLDIEFDSDFNTYCNFCNYKIGNNQCYCCNKYVCSSCEYNELCPKCKDTEDGINHSNKLNRQKFEKYVWIGEREGYVRDKMYDLFGDSVGINFTKKRYI